MSWPALRVSSDVWVHLGASYSEQSCEQAPHCGPETDSIALKRIRLLATWAIPGLSRARHQIGLEHMVSTERRKL